MMGHLGDAIATSGPLWSPGPVWNVAMDCIGHEVQLHQCSIRLMNNTCHAAAGVSCSSKKGEIDANLRSLLPTDCGVPEDFEPVRRRAGQEPGRTHSRSVRFSLASFLTHKRVHRRRRSGLWRIYYI
ncbi:uncharacterized protein [Penaeus vannamei]|uniref:uncharacterized protein isoform X1 n=1 Tax=Penaeus vannamei TaxID=6689 RepID=UPI00387F53B5